MMSFGVATIQAGEPGEKCMWLSFVGRYLFVPRNLHYDDDSLNININLRYYEKASRFTEF